MKVRFWGTRGSLPVAQTATVIRAKIANSLVAAGGQSFADAAEADAWASANLDFATYGTFGGATSCVEIETGGPDDAYILCDLGSGARDFGLNAMGRCAAGHPRVYHVFLSHMHWDHIMGMPFFVPAFDPNAEIVIHSAHADVEVALRRQQEEISFPVAFDWLRAKISFRVLETGKPVQIGAVTVEAIEQYHSHVSYGYRFTDAEGRSVIYSTDSEHKLDRMDSETDIVRFFSGADLVVCDTMYSLADTITMKEDWGHSSNIVAVDLCHEAKAKRLVLFHHEPVYSDADIQRVHQESVRYEELTREADPLEVICAYDGLTLEL